MLAGQETAQQALDNAVERGNAANGTRYSPPHGSTQSGSVKVAPRAWEHPRVVLERQVVDRDDEPLAGGGRRDRCWVRRMHDVTFLQRLR